MNTIKAWIGCREQLGVALYIIYTIVKNGKVSEAKKTPGIGLLPHIIP
jgi:hypothetical protein